MPELAGAVVLRRRGGVVVGLKSGIYAFDVDAGELEPIYTFENGHPDDRTNDSRCDRQGRLWFSRMRDYGRAPTGAVYRMDQALQPISMISELSVPNTICFSPGGDHTYLADTSTGEIAVFDIDAEDGKLEKHKPLLPADAAPRKPAGATVCHALLNRSMAPVSLGGRCGRTWEEGCLKAQARSPKAILRRAERHV